MRAFCMGAVLLALATPVLAQDRDGEDHPLLPRYADADIVGYRAPSLDEIVVPTGPIANEAATANRQVLEGRVTHIDYRVKPATAPLQIERYYQRASCKARALPRSIPASARPAAGIWAA